ncbi:MAG: Cell division protein FtsX [Myxococcaceae bacterium]|nr:Cell division protein FtsX [Myxococcaceae bacterium]
MDIKSIYARARRGVREDVKLYLVAVSSLTVAFLCLATALLGVANLAELADHWGRTHRMSVYLQDGAPAAEVARLTSVLSTLPSVARADYASAELAREQFLRGNASESALRELPQSAFPASIEVQFVQKATEAQIEDVARKVALQQAVVEDVDTYRSWFQRVGALVGAGRALAVGLGLLVLLCVLAVVANTIRLAVANRKEEIEVLKMCGATNAFVRAPFVLEGTLQGLFAAVLALLLLLIAYLSLREQLDATLHAFAGMQLVFLPPLMAVSLLVGGASVGALGSAWSVRRYISV